MAGNDLIPLMREVITEMLMAGATGATLDYLLARHDIQITDANVMTQSVLLATQLFANVWATREWNNYQEQSGSPYSLSDFRNGGGYAYLWVLTMSQPNLQQRAMNFTHYLHGKVQQSVDFVESQLEDAAESRSAREAAASSRAQDDDEE